MEHTIRWDSWPEDVLITTAGAPTAEDADALIRGALEDPRFRPGLKILLDHRSADFGALTHDMARERAERIVRSGQQLEGARIAIVVSRAVDYGILQVVRALTSGRVPFQTAVHYTLEEARSWLLLSD